MSILKNLVAGGSSLRFIWHLLIFNGHRTLCPYGFLLFAES